MSSSSSASEGAIFGFDLSGIDPAFKGHAGRGIGRYVQSLWEHLSRYGGAGNQDLVPGTAATASSDLVGNLAGNLAGNQSVDSRQFLTRDRFIPQGSPRRGDLYVESFNFRDCALPKVLDGVLNLAPVGKQTLRQQVAYPMRLRTGKMRRFNLLHFAAQMDGPSWSPTPFILTVHDLIPLVCGHMYGGDERSARFKFARWLELRSMRAAQHLIASSENTAKDLVNYLNIPRSRISVVPLGVDARFFRQPSQEKLEQVRQRFGLMGVEESILYVGGIDPRKNILRLVEIFSEVLRHRSSLGRSNLRLIIAGGIQNHENYPALLAKIKELGIEENVQLLGYVADEELLALYHLATLFLFASSYEGFGLPVAEAMAAGLPVVCANSSSLPEVIGDCGELFDPQSVPEGTRAVINLLDSKQRQQELRTRGPLQASYLSWEKTARLTFDVYKQVYEELLVLKTRAKVPEF